MREYFLQAYFIYKDDVLIKLQLPKNRTGKINNQM